MNHEKHETHEILEAKNTEDRPLEFFVIFVPFVVKKMINPSY